jgi:DNA repair protein SbcC/Rad50
MMLKRLVVRNWRAFGAAEVAFRPGVNVLLGRNGVGKTSLLEATAYALAGEPSMLSDVRQLARADGPVDVALTVDLDGTEWEICRGLGPAHRRGAEVVRRGGATVADGGEQVAAALQRLFEVPNDFFLRILYMPEGDVYRFLGNSPLSALDDHLRRVLGLERLALIDRAAAQVKRDLANERSSLATVAERLASRDQLLADGRARWSGDLDERRRALEAEQSRLAAVTAEASQQRRAAEDAVHRMARAIADLEAIERQHGELSGDDDPTRQLRELRTRCAQLRVSIGELDGTLAELGAEQRRLAEQRQLLATRSAADLAAGDEQLRDRYRAIGAAIGTLDQEMAALATEAEVVARAGQRLRARTAADLVADDPTLRARRDEREQSIRRLDDDLAAAASERQALTESTQFLEAHAPGAGASSVCPVCRQPLPEVLRQRLLAENAAQHVALDERVSALRTRRETLVAEAGAEAEELKRRLLEEHAEAADALNEREATLRGQRRAHQEALHAEVQATRQRLLEEQYERVQAVEDRLRALRVERQAAQATLENTERQEGLVLERSRRLADLAERRRTLLPPDAAPDILHERHARLVATEAAARDHETTVLGQADAVRQELTALQGYLELAALEGRSSAARTALARRELLAELFAAATSETQRRLREGALTEAYGAVERAWSDFSGWTDAQVEPRPRGRLAVRHDGRSLDLAQLSGGERAAFLVLLHAQLGHRFGRGGFLLLDEPLEHLDAENGRRMLECLVRACRDGLLKQIVLATVEADVVRAAVRPGDAHLIELPL